MSTSNDIYLQLGDIIQIDSPTNIEYNQHIFIIHYIDKRKIKIIDEDTLATHTLNIDSDGNLSDESILSISILNRAETNSYARQNDLLPDTWITVHFGGDLPTTITGQITNLEEDMIEIEILNESMEPELGDEDDAQSTNKEIIYIDFGYKGIPEDIPIDKIVIRDAPEISKKIGSIPSDNLEEASGEEKEEYDWPGKEEGEIYQPERHNLDTIVEIPIENVKTNLKILY